MSEGCKKKNTDQKHKTLAEKTNVDDLVVDIFDIITDCRDGMYVPIFDVNDFGYFYIYEYLKSIGIQ